MGLLDILNGMQNGPSGPSDPNDKSGGMSPMTMAVLALLAYKGYKHVTAGHAGQDSAPARADNTTTAQAGGSGGGLGGMLGGLLGGGASSGGALGGALSSSLGGALSSGLGGSLGSSMGGIGNLLKGPLGGLLAGGAAGGILSGGLSDLMKQLQDSGHGEVANSWVGNGENKPIAPGDLANALGADQVKHIAAQAGLSPDDLLAGLAKQLPDVVNHLTPHGRLPTENEASSMV